MQTRQLIEASATVTTIVEFATGSVYKRVQTDGYGGPKLLFGVVTDVMHNGTDAAFTSIEYSPAYGTVNVEQKVFTSTGDVALFRATPDEFRTYLADLTKAADNAVVAAEKALHEAREKRDRVAELADRARLDGGLSEPVVVIGELAAPAVDA